MKIHIAQTDTEKSACYPVLAELRPHLTEAGFLPQVKRQEGQGYRLAYVENEGLVLAVAGFCTGEALAWGRYMYVFDLVTSKKARSQGCGKALLDFLKGAARAEGCRELHLDSGVQRFGAHKFYLREGFRISSHHFALELL